jgi:hypothetical protein
VRSIAGRPSGRAPTLTIKNRSSTGFRAWITAVLSVARGEPLSPLWIWVHHNRVPASPETATSNAKAQAGSLSAGSASEGVDAILDDDQKAPKPTIDGAVEAINLPLRARMGKVSEGGSHDRWLTAALTEFQALRGEIVQRIQRQQVLLGLAITALGALLSVALVGKTSRASLLLATPFVTSALGFAYSDHARRINVRGEYIKDELWSHIRSLTDGRLSSGGAPRPSAFASNRFQARLSSAYILTLFVCPRSPPTATQP